MDGCASLPFVFRKVTLTEVNCTRLSFCRSKQLNIDNLTWFAEHESLGFLPGAPGRRITLPQRLRPLNEPVSDQMDTFLPTSRTGKQMLKPHSPHAERQTEVSRLQT